MSAPKLKLRKYGFGIVDRNGEPYWAEDCVCADRDPLEGLLVDLNYPDDPKAPYKVVRLYWRGKA